jgi:integrase
MSRKEKNTRRGNNEGSVYQRRDGGWCGQILLGYQPNGKPHRKTVYGKTRDEVSQKVIRASSDRLNGVVSADPGNMTVHQLVNDWLFNFKKPSVTARTFEWYLNITKAHIFKELDCLPIKKLTLYHIQNLLNRRMNDGLSQRTVKAIRDILNQAMNHAVEMKLLTENPVSGSKLPKGERKAGEKVKAIPVELRKQILDAASLDPLMMPVVFILMFTGMRIGELLALPWKNTDFKNGVITIDRAVTLNPDYEPDGVRISRDSIIAAPKTCSGNRKIRIPNTLAQILRQWHTLQKNKDPELVDGEAVVFPNQKGDRYTYGGFRTVYRRFLTKHSLDGRCLNLHSYRHNLATMLLEQGVNPRIVQKLLGHKEIKTTLDIYSHVMEEVYDGVAVTLDDIYCKIAAGSYRPKALKAAEPLDFVFA